MKNLGKIAGINLLILFIYMVLIYIGTTGGGEEELGLLISAALCIAVHVFTNFVIGLYFLFTSQSTKGLAFLLSAGIVLLVGFSSCLGSFAV